MCTMNITCSDILNSYLSIVMQTLADLQLLHDSTKVPSVTKMYIFVQIVQVSTMHKCPQV